MAYTRTVHTLTAGFSGSDVFVKLGEALNTLGLITSATGWYDSFTDVNGSEVRIVEQVYTGDSGTYNTVYHAFMTKTTFDGLWYTVYYDWDVSTHESLGVVSYDFVSAYEHPDDISYSTWASYYIKLSSFPNAADMSFITYQSGTDMQMIKITGAGESRVFFFVPSTATLQGVSDYSDYGPLALCTLFLGTNKEFSAAPLTATNRSVCGKPNTGSASFDWTLSTNSGAHASGGSNLAEDFAGQYNIVSITGSATLNWQSGNYRTPYYLIARNIPALPNYVQTMGSNCALISGENGSAFMPSPDDTLIVSAGVEEYEVLQVRTGSNQVSEWVALLARLV